MFYLLFLLSYLSLFPRYPDPSYLRDISLFLFPCSSVVLNLLVILIFIFWYLALIFCHPARRCFLVFLMLFILLTYCFYLFVLVLSLSSCNSPFLCYPYLLYILDKLRFFIILLCCSCLFLCYSIILICLILCSSS